MKVDVESPREAYLQALLSRGDRRVAPVLEAIHRADGDWWSVVRRWQREGIDGLPHPDEFVHRRYGEEERLPWDFIDHRIAKGYLWMERRRGSRSAADGSLRHHHMHHLCRVLSRDGG